MVMSGETPFNLRMSQITDISTDMRDIVRSITLRTNNSNSKALLLMLVDNWQETRLTELVQLTVGKDNLSDVTEEEIQLLGLGEIQKSFMGLIQ
tara:strand:+ start:2502 stop:2783 length:282 start_codon:yes stop_codon:yes gene_type:complete